MFQHQEKLTTQSNIKSKLLDWANQFNYVAFLDTCNYNFTSYENYDFLFAVANNAQIENYKSNTLQDLEKLNLNNKWQFGFLSYDLKNEIQGLPSNNFDGLKMPNALFFEAEFLIYSIDNETIVEFNDRTILSNLKSFLSSNKVIEKADSFIKSAIYQRIEKEQYFETISKIKEDIVNGVYYELNYCREFYSTNVKINALETYQKLTKISPAPMSSFVKLKDKFLICSSPERFLKKRGNKLFAQPMKGTIKRAENFAEDELLKVQLYNSVKDRAENVMIVDLMRNDLTKCSKLGTINVDELFEVYTFPQVHTMISTITSELQDKTNFTDILKATFPMGSMTGAPKLEVMKYIEKYEASKRGLYAGAVGYITPNNDFDFNVVIRSIIYNQTEQYLSFQTGGAIVFDSDAQSEFDETNLKAKALINSILS